MKKTAKIFLYLLYLLILLEIVTRLFLAVSLNRYMTRLMDEPYRSNIREFCNISQIRGRQAPFNHFEIDPVCYSVPKDGRFFRGPETHIACPKKKEIENEVRIMCIGDSTTFGIAVDYYNSWEYLLERSLQEKYPDKRIRVLNAGIPGGLSRQIKRIFQLYLAEYNSDIVLYKGECVLSDNYEIKYQKFPIRHFTWRALYSSRLYRAICIIIDQVYRKDKELTSSELVFDFFHKIKRKEQCYRIKETPEFKTDFDVIRKISLEYDTKYVIAIEDIGHNGGVISGNRKCLKEKGVEHVVDLFHPFGEKLKSMPIEDIFVDCCHLTEHGTSIIAEEVFKYLNKNCSDILK